LLSDYISFGHASFVRGVVINDGKFWFYMCLRVPLWLYTVVFYPITGTRGRLCTNWSEFNNSYQNGVDIHVYYISITVFL